jgi:hypothetical protein
MPPANAAIERMPGGGTPAKAESPSAVRIKVKPLTGSATKPRVRYWMGTFPSCPIQNVTAGGHVFQRFTGTPTLDAHGRPDHEPPAGCYNDLDEDQVERVKMGVELRVMRWMGVGADDGDQKTRRAIILMSDAPGFKPAPGDEPLAKYLYMTTQERRETLPPPMLEE